MNGEGYIKFNIDWKESAPVIPAEEFIALNTWREVLYKLEMIGADDQGIGFGNISVRKDRTRNFFITGSATGSATTLGEEHYSLVTGFDIKSNTLSCIGPVKASAESLSHAAVYSTLPEMNAVIHIHHHVFWTNLLEKVAATSDNIDYGTPEMATAIQELLCREGVKDRRVIVMAGHTDGILFFGKHLDEAGAFILSYFNEVV
ncbi:MAG: class II aldolase/adducin family protein [Bacteroidales bacterium]|nr:class II aldolase/adducin family protein [Bacteroidales bacterium]